jgi:hypothetical protein
MGSMTHKLLLATLLCILTVSCTSVEQAKFTKIVSRIDKYFSSKPVILTSQKITKNDEEVYAYYALKIIDHSLSYNTARLSSASGYSATVPIICNSLRNSKSGDLISDISEFQTQLGVRSKEPGGFSTTNMALADGDFSESSKWTILIRYFYRNHGWIYQKVEGGPSSESFVHDLEIFPQNKEFRQAIGMVG